MRLPSGRVVLIPDDEISLMGGAARFLFSAVQHPALELPPLAEGSYEVRWYAAASSRMDYYEVTRETFVLELPSPESISPEM